MNFAPITPSTVTGEAVIRAPRLICHTPLEGVPYVEIELEQSIATPLGVLTQPAGRTTEFADDPARPLPLLDPLTGEQIGTTNIGEVLTMLYSLTAWAVQRKIERENPAPRALPSVGGPPAP